MRHVVGERFLAGASPARDGRDGILYQVIGYEDRLPLVYVASDLVVGRAGAGTVCEVAAIGVPSILVPWPGAAEDHQTDNARTLAEVGAAVLVARSPSSTPLVWRPRSTGWSPTRAARGEMAVGRPGRRRTSPQPGPDRPDRGGGRVAGAELTPRCPPRLPPLDLSQPGRYHVVGVGGPGMSAIALVLAQMGHDVSGSDLRELPCSTGCGPPGAG